MSGAEEIRVLVVEDEETAADAHAVYVGRLDGFRTVGVARSAADAARVLAREPVDLVLLDMHLPDGHGLGLLQRMRSAGKACDVIAVTSARDADVVRHAVASGVVLYLLKPFTFATFRAKLEQYASYRASLRAAEAERADQGLGQSDLDRIFTTLRDAPAPVLPKGMSQETLREVIDAVRGVAGASATEVAARVGASRVTVRRYLEHLAESGRVDRAARYGSTGRPEVEYRWREG